MLCMFRESFGIGNNVAHKCGRLQYVAVCMYREILGEGVILTEQRLAIGEQAPPNAISTLVRDRDS